MDQLLIIIYLLIFLSITFTVINTSSANKIEFATMLWVLLFSLGMRTLHIGNDYKLHPLTLLIVLITLAIALTRGRSAIKHKTPIKISRYFVMFVIIGVWGLIIGYRNKISFGIMMNEFQNILIYLPISYVFNYLIHNDSNLEKFSTIYIFTALIISVLGLVEIFVSHGVTWQDQIYSTNFYYENFARAKFSFFGTPAASILIAFGSTMLISKLNKFRTDRKKFLGLLLIFTINTAAIYFSGTRVAWLIWILSLESMTFVISKKLFILINILITILAINYLPIGGKNVILSLIDPFLGRGVLDTSTLSRINRAKFALEAIRNNPFGYGWGGTGWVHSDFIQIASNLGIVAPLIWVIWYLNIFIKAFITIRNKKIEFWVVTLNFSFVGLVLLFEGVQVLTNFIAPMWLFWVIAEIYQKKYFKEIGNENINPSANF